MSSFSQTRLRCRATVWTLTCSSVAMSRGPKQALGSQCLDVQFPRRQPRLRAGTGLNSVTRPETGHLGGDGAVDDILASAHPPHDGDPVELGETDIEDGDVRFETADRFEGLPPLLSGIDDLETGLLSEAVPRSGSHQRVIVRDNDANHSQSH